MLLCPFLTAQTIPLESFGYTGEFWDLEKLILKIDSVEGKYHFEFTAYRNGKKTMCKNGDIDFEIVESFWKYINCNNILKIKSASLLDPTFKDEDFELLYKNGIEHQSAFIYEFYFLINNNEKIRFKVDDLENISDERYFAVLNKMNNLTKLPSFKTIFDYHEYLNAQKGDDYSCEDAGNKARPELDGKSHF